MIQGALVIQVTTTSLTSTFITKASPLSAKAFIRLRSDIRMMSQHGQGEELPGDLSAPCDLNCAFGDELHVNINQIIHEALIHTSSSHWTAP